MIYLTLYVVTLVGAGLFGLIAVALQLPLIVGAILMLVGGFVFMFGITALWIKYIDWMYR